MGEPDTGRDDRLVCHNYTPGRRHPMVVGRIGGWALPTPLSPAQLLAGLGSFALLAVTGGLWQPLAPGILRVLVLGGVPLTAGWAVRHAKVEGRSPVRAALGWLRLLMSPTTGVVHGRPVRRPRTVRIRARSIVQSTSVGTPAVTNAVVELPDHQTATAPSAAAVASMTSEAVPRPRWSCLDTAA